MGCQTRTTQAIEVISNLHTDDIEGAREFFGFLGLTEDGMNQGWVARFTSSDSGACVQVVTRDATAPEDSVMTIKVDDVDAAYEDARQRGYEIVHPITNEPWGIRRFFVRSPDGHVINVAQHRS
ncbi:MAG: VOC family protein [Polyangiaceae bacterium]